MTALEDRVTPAHNLTIGGAVTAGVTIDTVTTPGTTIFIATADNASVSTSDFATAATTGPVVATSDLGGTQAGNITNELAASIGGGTLNLTFLTASNATVGDIVFNQFFGAVGAGAVNYTVNAKHDIVFNTADVSFNTGTATLVAGNAIVQTSGRSRAPILPSPPAPASVPPRPLATQVSNLEAQTGTGGIVITNTGALNIGGVSAALGGVRVTTSGDIVLTNTGSVSIVTAGEIVRSPGNVTVRALGAAADLTTGGNNNGVILQAGAVQSLNGNVIVEAGRDVLAGGPSLGDILADAGSVTMSAGRDVSVTNGTTVGNFTNVGGLTVTAGRNITANSTGNVVAPFNTAGSLITLTTGTGGTFSVTGAVPGVDASSNTFNDGNIVISADDMVIAAPIAADDAIVTLQQASTTTRNIDLGLGTTVGSLGLAR